MERDIGPSLVVSLNIVVCKAEQGEVLPKPPAL